MTFRKANTINGCNDPTLKGEKTHQQTKRMQTECIEVVDIM